MKWKTMLAVLPALLPLAASAGAIAGFSDEYPNVWFRTFNMDLQLGPVTTSESYEARANHNGTAALGPCSFFASPGEFRLRSGGWYGEVRQPGGQASGALDCRLSVDVTVLDEIVDPAASLYPWFFVATRVEFDPLREVAEYGWSMGARLTSLDTGAVRLYQESRSGHCGADDPLSSPFDCVATFDDSGGLVSGLGAGERWRFDLWINLHFDARAVPEPSILPLIALALLPGALLARSRRR